MKKFIAGVTMVAAGLAFAPAAAAECPPGQSQQGAYCEVTPPGRPEDRPPVDPGPGNPPGQPEDRPVAGGMGVPVAAGTANFASLTTAQFLSEIGLDAIAEKRGYIRTFVAPGPGVYQESIYAPVQVSRRSGSARAASHTRTKYVLLMAGRRNFKSAGVGTLKVRLTKRGAALLKRNTSSLQLLVRTRFQRTRNGRVTTRQTSMRKQTVRERGTVA